MSHVQPGFEGKRLAYNFRNLRFQSQDDSLVPRTIEFRQHEGTVDLEAISTWVKVVCGIVVVSYQYPAQAERAALQAATATLGIGDYDAIDMLRDLGLNLRAGYYQRRLRERKVKHVDIYPPAQDENRRMHRIASKITEQARSVYESVKDWCKRGHAEDL